MKKVVANTICAIIESVGKAILFLFLTLLPANILRIVSPTTWLQSMLAFAVILFVAYWVFVDLGEGLITYSSRALRVGYRLTIIGTAITTMITALTPIRTSHPVSASLCYIVAACASVAAVAGLFCLMSGRIFRGVTFTEWPAILQLVYPVVLVTLWSAVFTIIWALF
jgi:hypothetical protein